MDGFYLAVRKDDYIFNANNAIPLQVFLIKEKDKGNKT